MKILFNTPNPSLHGGPPTHLPFLEQGLREHCAIFPFEYGRKSDNETTRQKLFGRLNDLAATAALLAAVKPDLIHHNSAFDPRAILRDVPLAMLAQRFSVPLFIKVHGSLPEAFTMQSRISLRLRNSLTKNVAGFGVLSTAERNEFEEAFPELTGKVHVVKNIVKDEFFNVIRSETERPEVLFISRFIRRKGIFDLLDAVPHILHDIPSARFTFIGDGEDAHEFDKRVAFMKLDSAVQRISHIDNSATRAYLQRASVFVFPTHFPEGMPMVVAEAMAAGLPIVTTRTRFSQSYMKHGEHCLFSEYGNAMSIADQTITLLKSVQMRNRMSEMNRILAASFRQEHVTLEFLQLYDMILERNEFRFEPQTCTVAHQEPSPQPTAKEQFVNVDIASPVAFAEPTVRIGLISSSSSNSRTQNVRERVSTSISHGR
ncbi:MAG: glycosyltransferase family 4 protein [Candidatus Kapabacteria bacterium]|nr:glycosyltransferase family 4 protein [Candidatus Kapabacteria bacterium]